MHPYHLKSRMRPVGKIDTESGRFECESFEMINVQYAAWTVHGSLYPDANSYGQVVKSDTN